MIKQIKRIIRKILIPVGVLLIIGATAALILWQTNISTSEIRNERYVSELMSLIPEPQSAFPEERRDNTMSALSLDGTDFIGIIEMPRYSSTLPVCGKWGKNNKYPCRLGGSIYAGTLQIGSTSQKGQYDFYREITVGDAVYLTDMEGNRYSLEVTDIRYANHADQSTLTRETATLTLFIKNIYGFDYLIVYCNLK